MQVEQTIKSFARASLLASLGMWALSACSSLEAQDDAPQFSGQGSEQSENANETPEGSEEDSGSDNDQETKKTPKEDTEDESPGPTPEKSQGSAKEPKERSCDQIEWSEKLREGEVVVLGKTRGYLDTDGDNKVEEKETEVGMCQLHKTGKKCGMVFYARRT